MIRKTICMFVMNDVMSDARVQRMARTAVDAGFEVTVFGIRSSRTLMVESRDGYRVIRVDAATTADILERPPDVPMTAPQALRVQSEPTPGRWKRLQSLYDEHVTFAMRRNRVYQTLNTYDKRLRRALRRAIGRPSRDDLPPVAAKLQRSLADVRKWEASAQHMADHDSLRHDLFVIGRVMATLATRLDPVLCHCNDLDTLLAGYLVKMALQEPCGLVFDAHELYTEQRSPMAGRRYHSDSWYAFFDQLLQELVPHVDAFVTVNPSIALVLQSRHGLRDVVVVRNCPRLERVDATRQRSAALRAFAGEKRIALLHGGLIHMDRGLTELVDSARALHRTVLVLRGQGEARPELEQRVRELELTDRVRFEDAVPVDEVIAAASEADIGVIPYKPTSINNLLCSPNKLFEYMMAGLALAVSDLPELRRIVVDEGIGEVFNPCKPNDIAHAIDAISSDDERLLRYRQRAFAASETRYNWERESQKLMHTYEAVLSVGGRR